MSDLKKKLRGPISPLSVIGSYALSSYITYLLARKHSTLEAAWANARVVEVLDDPATTTAQAVACLESVHDEACRGDHAVGFHMITVSDVSDVTVASIVEAVVEPNTPDKMEAATEFLNHLARHSTFCGSLPITRTPEAEKRLRSERLIGGRVMLVDAIQQFVDTHEVDIKVICAGRIIFTPDEPREDKP